MQTPFNDITLILSTKYTKITYKNSITGKKMQRFASQYLKVWKDSSLRMPLIIRGARQTGKTYLVKQFATENFRNFVFANFEERPELCGLFKEKLDPQQIIFSLSALLDLSIIPGQTLLFFDEIQCCPKAIQALRYFYEKLPDLHVIAAGSFLEFAFNSEDFSMPVGRVEYLYLSPMSFKEFLQAIDANPFLEFIENSNFNQDIPAAVHQRGLELVRLYASLGGMPKVLETYIQHRDLKACQHIQIQLLNTYRDDFSKYGKKIQSNICEIIFSKASNLVAKNFKYVDVDPDLQSKQLKPALSALIKAGIFYQIFAVAADGIPLNSNMMYKKFKLLFLDVGLLKQMARLDMELVVEKNLHLIHQGRLIEQFVGQELIAYQSLAQPRELFYWEREQRGSTAEVDYLLQLNDKVIPIEVKAGKAGRLKSLQIFMQEHTDHKNFKALGVKISQDSLGLQNDILSVPLYMVGELQRLLGSY